jgi:hypothetical protein
MHGSSRSCCDQRALPLAASVFSLPWRGFDIRKVETVGDNLEDAKRIGCASESAEAGAGALARDKPSACRSKTMPAGAGTASDEGPEDAARRHHRRLGGTHHRVAPILGKESDRATGRWPDMCARGRNHDHGGRLIRRDGQADPIAVGWDILNRPNPPMGAALKLGSKGPFPWFRTRRSRDWNRILDLEGRP